MKKSSGKSGGASDESFPKLQLRVTEAKPRDLGKHRARIDSDSMRRAGVEAGEVIELTGKHRTAVTV